MQKVISLGCRYKSRFHGSNQYTQCPRYSDTLHASDFSGEFVVAQKSPATVLSDGEARCLAVVKLARQRAKNLHFFVLCHCHQHHPTAFVKGGHLRIDPGVESLAFFKTVQQFLVDFIGDVETAEDISEKIESTNGGEIGEYGCVSQCPRQRFAP